MTENPQHSQFLRETEKLELTQASVLLTQILQPNRATEYGDAYGFSDLDSPDAYRNAVPLVTYEDIRSQVDRMAQGERGVLTAERVLTFFKTSGSLSKPKLIPVTTQLVRQKVGVFATYWHDIYKQYPAIQTGTLVSNFADASEPEKTQAGIEICSESAFWSRRGRMLHSLDRWPLPADIRHVKDSRARLYATCRLLLQNPLHCIMCLNPSTLLQFCRTMQLEWDALLHGLESGSWGTRDQDILQHLETEQTANLASHLEQDVERARQLQTLNITANDGARLRLVDIWPELDLLICWQSTMVQPYLKLLAEYVDGVAMRDYITQSSECMMAIPVEDGISGGMLAYQSHFYEFIAESDVDSDQPKTLYAWQLTLGEKYEIVVSTAGGLYRYRMGDCVRVNGFNGQVPVIEFLYRFGKTSSMTGEKLTEFQTLDASHQAVQALGYGPEEFLMFPMTETEPGYGLLIDVGKQSLSATEVVKWGQAFASALCAANSEYADKLASGRLSDIQFFRVTSGALRQARHARRVNGVSEEQVKSEVLTRLPNLHRQYDATVCSQ